VEPDSKLIISSCCFSCLYFSVLSFFLPAPFLSGISNYPESTIATSDVTSESMVEINDPLLGNEKGDSESAPEMDGKLSLKMKLVSPETEASEESLQFSLESKFYVCIW